MAIKLNPQQQAACRYLDGPLLVLAGAGSGKTGVIARKIAYLIREQGYLPEKVAAITFTNKAAKEMRVRVGALLKAEAKGLRICTFHALGLRILYQHGSRLGYRPGFSIFDPRDSAALLRELLPKGGDKTVVEQAQAAISSWKASGLEPEAAAQQPSPWTEWYAPYQDKLKQFNAVDFDDLIMQPLILLRQDQDACLAWQQQLRHLLVDEYQDTNASQYQLLRLLVGERGALTAVGDDDQSIYGWRGAQPENLSLLQRDFPKLKVIKLEQNYRSARNILSAANRLIANNPHVYEKKLWSELGDGEPIRVMACDSDTHETEKVVAELIHRRLVAKCQHRDFAILYRSNHQARALEQCLRSHRIPYLLSGGQSFFDRAEVKDILAYLRLIANPKDDGAFLRVVNTPRREIGASSVEQIAIFAARENLPLLAASERAALAAKLPSRAAMQLQQLTAWLAELRAVSDPHAVAVQVVERSAYRNWLQGQSKDRSQAERRLAAIDDLLQFIRNLGTREGGGLPALLQQLALLGGDEDDDQDQDAVRLMTLHAAKGLEFPHVFMVGLEEGVLPHRSSIDEDTVAEERRLMYVGMTRAQRSLTLSFAKRRRRYGEVEQREPSRFLAELPEELLRWPGRDAQSDAVESKHRARAHLDHIRKMLAD